MKNDKQQNNHEQEEQKELRDFQNIEIDSPEELQKLLDQLAGSGNNNGNNKTKKIGIVNRLFPNILINLLFYIAFITIVTFALEGYLDIFKFEYFYQLLIFAVVFGIVDTLGRDLLYSKIPFIVLTSFGIITLLLTVVSSLGLAYIIPNFEIRSFGLYVLYIVILLILRFIVTMYLSKLLAPRFRKKYLGKRGK